MKTFHPVRRAAAAAPCVLSALSVLSVLFVPLSTLAAAEPRVVPHGKLEIIHGYTVVSVEGTPEQIGTAYGTLLKPLIQRVVKAMITDAYGEERYARMLEGSAVMAKFQPPDYLAELRAIAKAADVDLKALQLLQYFGDVDRGLPIADADVSFCTSFAILPPNTQGGICLVGRNFEFYDNGVGEYASLLAYYRPKGRIPFVTVTWAGVINGWTLLNERGIVVSNNTGFGARSNSLKGISTCFLLRYVAERAKSVAEGIELVRKGPRACGTCMLIASGNPPDGAILEFDHEHMAVLRPEGGFVGDANSFRKLFREKLEPLADTWGRLASAHEYVQKHKGRLDLSHNVAGAQGVPIVGMNLHSVNIDATNLRLRVAMGKTPACELPYKAFRLTDKGLVSDAAGPPTPAAGASLQRTRQSRWVILAIGVAFVALAALARAARRA